VRTIRRCAQTFVAIICGLGIDGATRLAAQEVVLPQPVKDALTRYANLNTFSVTWTQESQPGDVARARLDAPTLKLWSRFEECHLVWQDGKLFKRRKELPPGRKGGDALGIYEFAFDGRILASGRRHLAKSSDAKKSSRAVLRKDLAANSESDEDSLGIVELESFGIYLSGNAKELLKATHLKSQILFMLERGGILKAVGVEPIGENRLMRVAITMENPAWRKIQGLDIAEFERELRAEKKLGNHAEEDIKREVAVMKMAKEGTSRNLEYVYYLDSELGYAVRCWQQLTEDGRLRVQANCTDHQKLPGHELWLSRNCRIDYYTFDGNDPDEVFKTPFVTDVMEVSEFGTKPVLDEQFTLNYTKPGTKVADATFPHFQGDKAINYLIPANPQDLDRVIKEAQEKTRRRTRTDWGMNLAIIGNALVVAGIIAYLFIRHRRKVAKS
jgi:hypothetical protein